MLRSHYRSSILAAVFYFLLATWCNTALAGGAAHFVFFGTERQRIREASFLETKALAGAQLKYSWRELEPRPDAYDFSAIRNDLAFLSEHGKTLFVQLQEVTFSLSLINVPKYLLNDARYHGGAAKQYDIKGEDEARAVGAGWVARRWDGAVRERFIKLLLALDKEFDGKIAGINLPETAIEFGESGRLFPSGFTPAVYRDAVLATMTALKQAFPKSVTMVYANSMPGEWLPAKDLGYLRSVFRRARELQVGVGGPDLKPYEPGQMQHGYPFIRACHGSIPTGIAVQDGNYGAANPKTGKPLTIADLLAFATDYLQVDYIFWCTEEPFYSRKLLPFLKYPAQLPMPTHGDQTPCGP